MKSAPALDALAIIIAFATAFWLAAATGLPGAGTLGIAAGIGVGLWRLRRAGLGLRDVGLSGPRPVGRVLAGAALLVAATMLLVGLLVTPLGNALGWPPQDVSRFAGMRGDPLAFAGYLLLAWASAAFGEELLFRGMLLHRLRAALGTGAGATVFAVLLQALAFGVGHAYLGARGLATAVVVGLVFGTAWVRNGGRLAPLILAHGLIDTISMTAIYAGAVR